MSSGILVARWETRGGAHWLELYRAPRSPTASAKAWGSYNYKGNGLGGNLGYCENDQSACAEIVRRIIQPAADIDRRHYRRDNRTGTSKTQAERKTAFKSSSRSRRKRTMINTTTRKNTLETIRKLGMGVCGYSRREKNEWGPCDCKFQDGPSMSSTEQTGCCELRTIYILLSTMTDDEFNNILECADDETLKQMQGK